MPYWSNSIQCFWVTRVIKYEIDTTFLVNGRTTQQSKLNIHRKSVVPIHLYLLNQDTTTSIENPSFFKKKINQAFGDEIFHHWDF